jgi:flagellar motor switch protein FliN
VIKDSDNSGTGDTADIEKPDTAKRGSKVAATLDPSVFGDVEIELRASLGRGSMTVQEMLNITSGAVVPLETPLNGLVDLTLNGRIVARGEIVSVNDRFGVRVTEIVASKS